MSDWQSSPPRIFSVATGFFPETNPKETWATNPRPLLICGVGRQEDGTYICRIAYGTTKTGKAHDDDLVIGNVSALNSLNLKRPTCFVIHSSNQLAYMPWTDEFFRPWSGKISPILGRLSEDMQHHVGSVLASLTDLPPLS